MIQNPASICSRYCWSKLGTNSLPAADNLSLSCINLHIFSHARTKENNKSFPLERAEAVRTRCSKPLLLQRDGVRRALKSVPYLTERSPTLQICSAGIEVWSCTCQQDYMYLHPLNALGGFWVREKSGEPVWAAPARPMYESRVRI